MNRHNFCYANALLLSLIHLDGNLTEPSIFGGSLHLIVRRLSSERVFHLWDDPEWMRLTERWEQPHRQHHVTEFLLHVAKWPQLEAARLTVPWQARVLPEGEDHVQIVDMGQSAPLGLIPPCTLAEDARATFRVQDLVNCWHGQSGGSATSLTGYSFSPKAYAKAVLHSCKHSAAPVLGLLLGTANGKVLKVADAIPLFHTHALGPMLKIACMLAEEHCKAAGDLEIVGLYHATPSGSTEMTPVKAIADKLAQNFASASVWTLDASKLPEKQFAFKGLGRSKAGSCKYGARPEYVFQGPFGIRVQDEAGHSWLGGVGIGRKESSSPQTEELGGLACKSLPAGRAGIGAEMDNGQPGSSQAQDAAQAAQAAPGMMIPVEQVDRLVKQRLEQAFSGVFGRLLSTTEKAAAAAEATASSNRTESMMKGLKIDAFRPQTREEELRGWKDWWFQFSTYVCGHDPAFEDDFKGIDPETEVDHSLLTDAEVARSRKLFSLLCSLVKGRPLLLIKNLEGAKNGLEAVRVLRNAMEPKEKARSLALLRQLAGWTFQPTAGLHEQIVKYEEALRMYEEAAGKEFPGELGGRGGRKDEPQPMDVDIVKGKGKDQKGKKGKSKDSKGKGKDKGKPKGKPGDGKGWSNWADSKGWKPQGGSGGWNNSGWAGSGSWSNSGWSGGAPGGWSGGGKDGKGKQQKGKGNGCAICGDPRHWKNECPKGKGKSVNQLEQQAGQSAPPGSVAGTSTAASSAPSSASALRNQASYGINMVAAYRCETTPGCRVTEVFDISELEDEGVFSLEGSEVLVLSAAEVFEFSFGGQAHGNESSEFPLGDQAHDDEFPEVSFGGRVHDDEFPEVSFGGQVSGNEHFGFPLGGQPDQGELLEVPQGVQVFSMDVTDDDGNYTVAGYDCNVAGICAVSCPGPVEGHRINEIETRILEVAVATLDGGPVTIRERFSIARVKSVIISLGRLLRTGWLLGDERGTPIIHQDGHKVPIRLRRNTLTVGASISEIAAPEVFQENDGEEGPRTGPSLRPKGINMMTFDDMGPLPPELEDVVQTPGWHMPSGLPVLISHATEELELERSLSDTEDWSWIAIFVKVDESKGAPKAGDLWVQVLRRLRDHHEILEKQMSAEIAKKMFQENERVADVPRLPKLPSATQQALHNVTHHPFAAWREACVLGRSRQSPHPKPDEAIEDARKIQKMEMDYAVTFTKHRHEMQAGEGEANQGGADDGDDAGQVADNKA
eukprot:s6579_g1.t1